LIAKHRNNLRMFLTAAGFSLLSLLSCSPTNNNTPTGISDPPGSAAVDLTKEHQLIRGFGGMNCPPWVGDLTKEQADIAFGNETGQIGMSIMRIRIPYLPSEFSKEVPTAKIAKSYGATLIAAPWTPPPGMKNNNDTANGNLNESSYSDYAAHLKSFCDYMNENNAPLYAIAFANEPDYPPPYESCEWTASQSVNFLVDHADEIGDIRLIAGESFAFQKFLTDPILNNETAASKISIISGHIYGEGLVRYPLAEQKGKEVWMTEHFTNTDSANIWSSALPVGREIHDCMTANFSAYIWWYIRRFYGMIDESSNVTKRGYAFSQYSKFIRPGYIRVDVPENPQGELFVTAYKKGNNLVIVAVNQGNTDIIQPFTIKKTLIGSFTKYTTSGSKSLDRDTTSIIVKNSSISTSFEAMSVTTLVGTAD